MQGLKEEKGKAVVEEKAQKGVQLMCTTRAQVKLRLSLMLLYPKLRLIFPTANPGAELAPAKAYSGKGLSAEICTQLQTLFCK